MSNERNTFLYKTLNFGNQETESHHNWANWNICFAGRQTNWIWKWIHDLVLMLDPRIRLTYSWLDSVREIISRSFRIYSILLSKSLFSNLSKIIFFEMALKRCLLPKTQWVILCCLDTIYLDLDLSGDSILYVTVKRHSKPQITRWVPESRSFQMWAQNKNRDLNEEY